MSFANIFYPKGCLFILLIALFAKVDSFLCKGCYISLGLICLFLSLLSKKNIAKTYVKGCTVYYFLGVLWLPILNLDFLNPFIFAYNMKKVF